MKTNLMRLTCVATVVLFALACGGGGGSGGGSAQAADGPVETHELEVELGQFEAYQRAAPGNYTVESRRRRTVYIATLTAGRLLADEVIAITGVGARPEVTIYMIGPMEVGGQVYGVVDRTGGEPAFFAETKATRAGEEVYLRDTGYYFDSGNGYYSADIHEWPEIVPPQQWDVNWSE